MITASTQQYARMWFAQRWLPLELATWIVPLFLFRAGAPIQVANAVAVLFQLILLGPTYRRLKDAGLSGWLLLLNFAAFRFGPSWDGLGFTTLYLGQMIHLLIPVLCLTLPSRSAVRQDSAATA